MLKILVMTNGQRASRNHYFADIDAGSESMNDRTAGLFMRKHEAFHLFNVATKKLAKLLKR